MGVITESGPMAVKALINAAIDSSRKARMQRAKDQGFGQQRFYKGQSADITAYDPSIEGAFKASDTGGTVSFTTDPQQASRYARESITEEWDDELNRNITNEITVNGKHTAEGANVGEYLLPENIKIVDAEGRGHNPQWMKQQQQAAKDEGFDGIQFQGMQDDTFYNPIGMPTDTTQIFDPSNIRSVNAQFDPAKRKSSKLLASAMGVGVLGTAALTPKRQKLAPLTSLTPLPA